MKMQYINWLREWLNNYVRPTAKTRTFDRYENIVEKHVIPALGEYELNKVTPDVLQKFVTKLLQSGNGKTGKGLSANSVGVIVSVIQNSLKTAFSLGYISEYTANRVKRPKKKEKTVECFSVPEQKKIEQAVLNDKRDKTFGIILCLYTGLRI